MSGWVEANGVSLRYAVRGCGDRTVVLLHEMGGLLESWGPVVERLRSSVVTIAYDARGAGLSEKPTGRVTIDDLADDLGGLLDALNVHQPVTLVGCAVGAAVAVHFAARAPERVCGLIALSPAIVVAPEQRAALLSLADVIETGGVRPRLMERFAVSYPERLFEGRSDRPDVRGRLLHNDPRAYAETYRMLCRMEIAAELPTLQVPTLVLAGAFDRTRPPELVREVADAIPGARFEVVDSGHVMHILTPDLVAEHVMSFLAEIKGT